MTLIVLLIRQCEGGGCVREQGNTVGFSVLCKEDKLASVKSHVPLASVHPALLFQNYTRGYLALLGSVMFISQLITVILKKCPFVYFFCYLTCCLSELTSKIKLLHRNLVPSLYTAYCISVLKCTKLLFQLPIEILQFNTNTSVDAFVCACVHSCMHEIKAGTL